VLMYRRNHESSSALRVRQNFEAVKEGSTQSGRIAQWGKWDVVTSSETEF
jgi:hypothetical protein